MDSWLVHLEKTLPAEKFGRFLKALSTTCRDKGQLHWWMEREWEKLVERRPEFASIDPLAVEPICYLHRKPLHEERLKIVYGYFDPPHGTDCPFGRPFATGPDWGGEENEAVALVCDQCREVYDRKHHKYRGEQGAAPNP